MFFDFLFTGPSVHESLQIPDDSEFARMAAEAGNVYFPLLFQEPAGEARAKGDPGAVGTAGHRQLRNDPVPVPEPQPEPRHHGHGQGQTAGRTDDRRPPP